MNKKVRFERLLNGKPIPKIMLKPILMHFAAKFKAVCSGLQSTCSFEYKMFGLF